MVWCDHIDTLNSARSIVYCITKVTLRQRLAIGKAIEEEGGGGEEEKEEESSSLR